MELLVLLYLVGFIRTLLVIVIIYFGIRIVTRYILPLLVDKGLKNMHQKMQNQQRQNQQHSRPEGDVTIEKDRNQQSNNSNKQGEYVDFEEVE